MQVYFKLSNIAFTLQVIKYLFKKGNINQINPSKYLNVKCFQVNISGMLSFVWDYSMRSVYFCHETSDTNMYAWKL